MGSLHLCRIHHHQRGEDQGASRTKGQPRTPQVRTLQRSHREYCRPFHCTLRRSHSRVCGTRSSSSSRQSMGNRLLHPNRWKAAQNVGHPPSVPYTPDRRTTSPRTRILVHGSRLSSGKSQQEADGEHRTRSDHGCQTGTCSSWCVRGQHSCPE